MLTIDVTNQEALQNFIARRHPQYVENHAHWRFCEETYKGGREWFRDGNIHKYVKEGDDEYAQRVNRAYRFNHTREVVDLIVKYLFKSAVARNTGDAPKYVKNFWKKATRSGLDIGEFMRVVATKTAVFGRVYVFVDSTKTQTVVTRADEKRAKAGCYVHIVTPIDVLDIGYSEDGEIEWMLVREHVRDDSDPIYSSGIVRPRYRLWTKTSWHVFEVRDNGRPVDPLTGPQPDGSTVQLELPGVFSYNMKSNESAEQVVLVDEGVTTIGCVPVVAIDNVIGEHRYHSPALINDVAYLDRAVANYLSNLDAIIQDQTFSQLAMPAQNVLPGEDAYDKLMQMGTKRIFLYDGEGGGKPEFLSPDPRQAQLVMAIINKIINEIYHSLGLAGERTKEDNATGIDNSSGVAKAYDFERLNSLLITKSEACENAEKQIIRLLALWNGDEASLDPVTGTLEEPDTAIVKYADTFDTRSLYDEFTVAERLSLIDAPAKVRQQQMEQVIDKLFPAIEEGLKKAMLDDMENSWPITGMDQISIQGVMDGNPSAKFPARLTSTKQPGMKPAPSGPAAPQPKNPGTQNRQGQNNKGK